MKIKSNIDDIRNYDWVPSVTWLLSLLELPSFEVIKALPNFETIMKEAWIRWTYVHKFIEDDLNWKEVKIIKKHSDYIKQWIIYKASTQIDRTVFKLEEKIETKELCWTIDYTRYEEILTPFVKVKDRKTSSTLNLSKDLEFKYKMQIGWYAVLKEMSWDFLVIEWEIVILSPKWCKTILMDQWEVDNYKSAFYNLLNYYKGIKKWTIYKKVFLYDCEIEVINSKKINKKLKRQKKTKKKYYVDEAQGLDMHNEIGMPWSIGIRGDLLRWLRADTVIVDEAESHAMRHATEVFERSMYDYTRAETNAQANIRRRAILNESTDEQEPEWETEDTNLPF